MIQDNLALTGALTIAINDEVVQRTKNLVVDDGKEWVARRMSGADSNMTHMAIGTSTSAAAAGNTGLGTELERNALTVSGGTVGTGADANTIVYACTYGAGDGTGGITEAGIFDTLGSKVDDITVTLPGSSYSSDPDVVVGVAHASGQTIAIGDQRFYGTRLYTSTTAGTTGSTSPVHTSGTVSDGTVSWAFAGAVAVATAARGGGTTVTAVTVSSAGSGYTKVPTISFTGGSGSGAAATATLKEGGDMLARTVFSIVNKGAADSMTITWTITVS
jgi:hypothetical protein